MQKRRFYSDEFKMEAVRRWNTHGNHALVWNVLMNWNDLRTGWPERKKGE